MLKTNEVIANSNIAFGTSGARGLVTDFTTEVCAAFAHAFVNSMKANFNFKKMAIGIDNRPSSYAMAQACAAALAQQGIELAYYGVLPTPALAYSAMQENIPCIMVTGSHIPFDRNGLKFYRPDGEISKADEQAINQQACEFEAPTQLVELTLDNKANQQYLERYLSLFDKDLLAGKRIGIYEHSSAGREIYQKLFEQLGADVIALERSDEFVPIDTEAVSEADKEKARAWSKQYNFDAVFSTDGDGDRPLLSDENGEWLRGDILGLLCAQALNIDALAVPVSCNTAIEASNSFKAITRTRIGSPYVIAEFADLSEKFSAVAGFEANGGFLLGSDANGLKALPTRDAILPALMVLAESKKQNTNISALVGSLPKRYTYSDRIQNFATEKSKAIIAKGVSSPGWFVQELGLSEITNVDTTDGMRISLSSGDIVHFRPSGNAPELRCYAESDTEQKAKDLALQGLAKIKTIEA